MKVGGGGVWLGRARMARWRVFRVVSWESRFESAVEEERGREFFASGVFSVGLGMLRTFSIDLCTTVSNAYF